MSGSFLAGKPRCAESGFNARAIVFIDPYDHQGHAPDQGPQRCGAGLAGTKRKETIEPLQLLTGKTSSPGINEVMMPPVAS
jgi:hypothetical protein